MRTLIYLAFFGILIGFQSCEDSPTFKHRGRLGQSVAGEIGHLLVVCEDNIWNSDFKPYLDTNLTQFIMPYYPDVATFMLDHKTPKHFDKGVKRYRSILFVAIDPNLKSDKVKVEKRMDVWAIDQLTIDITAKNPQQLMDFCKTGGLQSIHSEFDYMEWRRIMNDFELSDNRDIKQKLATNFGIKLALPEKSILVNRRPDYFRIEFPSASRPIEFSNAGAQDRGTILSGIMIYQYDYIDSNQMDFKNLLQQRDTVLKIYAPYQIEGMYMGTQYTDLVYPEGSLETNFNGKVKGMDVRGMFVYTGLPINAPGGAFWSFHFVHPKRNKVMCISGYLDAPSTTSWIHQLREIQAVLRSVEIVD